MNFEEITGAKYTIHWSIFFHQKVGKEEKASQRGGGMNFNTKMTKNEALFPNTGQLFFWSDLFPNLEQDGSTKYFALKNLFSSF